MEVAASQNISHMPAAPIPRVFINKAFMSQFQHGSGRSSPVVSILHTQNTPAHLAPTIVAPKPRNINSAPSHHIHPTLTPETSSPSTPMLIAFDEFSQPTTNPSDDLDEPELNLLKSTPSTTGTLLQKSALKLMHLQLEPSNSGRSSPVVQVLSKEPKALRTARIQDVSCTSASSGRASPVVHHLAKRNIPTVFNSLAAPAHPSTQPSQNLLLPEHQQAKLAPPASAIASLKNIPIVTKFSSLSSSTMCSKSEPILFDGKYASPSSSGCHTPVPTYPGLDGRTLELIRRRQEDLRRRLNVHAQAIAAAQ